MADNNFYTITTSKEMFARVRYLLANHEIAAGLNFLEWYTKASPEYDEVIQLASRLVYVEKQVRQGTISEAEAAIIFNQVNKGALALVTEIEISSPVKVFNEEEKKALANIAKVLEKQPSVAIDQFVPTYRPGRIGYAERIKKRSASKRWLVGALLLFITIVAIFMSKWPPIGGEEVQGTSVTGDTSDIMVRNDTLTAMGKDDHLQVPPTDNDEESQQHPEPPPQPAPAVYDYVLSGSIRQGDGRPVSGVQVIVEGVEQGVSDDNGYFEVSWQAVRKQRVELRYEKEGFKTFFERKKISPADIDGQRINITALPIKMEEKNAK